MSKIDKVKLFENFEDRISRLEESLTPGAEGGVTISIEVTETIEGSPSVSVSVVPTTNITEDIDKAEVVSVSAGSPSVGMGPIGEADVAPLKLEG